MMDISPKLGKFSTSILSATRSIGYGLARAAIEVEELTSLIEDHMSLLSAGTAMTSMPGCLQDLTTGLLSFPESITTDGAAKTEREWATAIANCGFKSISSEGNKEHGMVLYFAQFHNHQEYSM